MAKTSPPCVPATRRPYPSNKGFTLVEVLVAIIILVLGVLGAAAMTTTALRNNHHSSSRSIAVGLTYELGEMMKSNPAVDASAGNLLSTVYLANSAAQRTACYGATGCTLQQQAENDLWEFGQRVAARLPGGQYVICRDASDIAVGTPAAPECDGLTTSPVVVKIWWTLRRVDGVVDTSAETTGVSVVLRPLS